MTDDIEAIGNEILDLLDEDKSSRAAEFFERRIYHAAQLKLVEAIADISPTAPRLICELASRQSGKSHGAGGAVLDLAFAKPGCNVVYVAATYDSCERMGFKPAKGIAETYELGCKPVDMEIRVPGGGTIYFLGANTEKFIDRLRGIPNLVACIIDECGIYKSEDLKTMIDTVMPGLRPFRGKLVLMGTPSKGGKRGTWWQATVNAKWLQLRMSYLDNDRVPSHVDVEALIDEELAALGYTRQSAYFLREYMCLFVVDATEKVYEITDENLIDDWPTQRFANYLTGGDIGERANDALVTFGWDEEPGALVYLVEEKQARGQDSIAFSEMVRKVDDDFGPLEVTIDPGGLGKKTIDTARGMYPGIPLTEALKGAVVLQVRAMNMLLKRLRLPRESQLAKDLTVPTWDVSKDGIKSIDEHGEHSDVAPAARYAAQKIIALIPEMGEVRDETAAQAETRRRMEEKAQRIAEAVRRRRMRDDPVEAMVSGDDGFDFEGAFGTGLEHEPSRTRRG